MTLVALFPSSILYRALHLDLCYKWLRPMYVVFDVCVDLWTIKTIKKKFFTEKFAHIDFQQILAFKLKHPVFFIPYYANPAYGYILWSHSYLAMMLMWVTVNKCWHHHTDLYSVMPSLSGYFQVIWKRYYFSQTSDNLDNVNINLTKNAPCPSQFCISIQAIVHMDLIQCTFGKNVCS